MGQNRKYRLSTWCAAVTVVFFLLLCLDASRTMSQGITSDQAKEILDEVRQIRQLLERRPVATPMGSQPRAPVERIQVGLTSRRIMGKPDAPATLLEFIDFECPFCRQFHISTFAQIKREYIDTGRLRYISRDLPLAMHPQAMPAALTARCAGEQNLFWEMHHALLINGARLRTDLMFTLARDIGLNLDQFSQCFSSEYVKEEIERDSADAQLAGVSGTPSFVLGLTPKDDREGLEGIKIVGAVPYSVFEARIKAIFSN